MNQDDGWEEVTRKSKRNDRDGLSENPLAWLDELPVIPDPSSFRQSALLLVGLPGSGKSTFSNTLCRCMPWKYVHINQDELKSRGASQNAMRSALTKGKCAILDRCNMSRMHRRAFRLPEFDEIPMDCVVFEIPVETCIRRCQQRRNHPTLAPSDAPKVVRWQLKDYQAVNPSEGFRTVSVVRDDTSFRRVLEALLQND